MVPSALISPFTTGKYMLLREMLLWARPALLKVRMACAICRIRGLRESLLFLNWLRKR